MLNLKKQQMKKENPEKGFKPLLSVETLKKMELAMISGGIGASQNTVDTTCDPNSLTSGCPSLAARCIKKPDF